MQRTITAFRTDEEGHWVAVLDCGHPQHVRHDPPMVERPWVLTPEGRADKIGQVLDCVRCDRFELPQGFVRYKQTSVFDEVSMPSSLLRDHTTKAGMWAKIVVHSGSIRYRVDPLKRSFDVTPSDPGIVLPGVPHHLEPCGAVRFHVEFYAAPSDEEPSVSVASPAPSSTRQDPGRLSSGRRVVFALGDFTTSVALSGLALLYATYFLTQYAGLRPYLAGLIPLIGRVLDAVTDPLMGRISDHWIIRGERRRPWLLLGALPFGVSYALLWVVPDFESQLALFLYYVVVYSVVSVSITVVSVPYMALIPEMATDYDDRTSLNTYRSVGSILGIFAAIAMRPVANALGDGAVGFALAGAIYGVALAVPWLWVWAITFERPDFAARPVRTSLRESLTSALRHRAFAQLTALYLGGRIAMDLIGAMLILYFTYWLGRSEDFEIAMFLFLATTIVALPVWLKIAQRHDKATLFLVGTSIWMVMQAIMVLATPEWPRWTLFVGISLAGVGYAVADLMPWAMLGEVIDEDDLLTGQRREGLYNGLFLFLRKLAGALAVFLALAILDVVGFEQGAEQTPVVRYTILILATVVPAACLASTFWFAREYPLTRAKHREIVDKLARRWTQTIGEEH